MPNSDLKDNIYKSDDDKKEKYTALAMQESRLNKAKEVCQKTGDCAEFQRLGGDAELQRLEAIIHQYKSCHNRIP